MSTIIACIDLTTASENALRFATKMVKKNNLKLKILAVIDGSHRNLLFGSGAMSTQKHSQIQKHLKKLIDNICLKEGVEPEISVREGDIVTEITKEVKSVGNCQMIVFGKSQNFQSDNTVLPKIVGKIGDKINSTVMIIPQNISPEFWNIF
jgi:nucleotide-binding universal stress UspA family protein